MQAQEVYIHHSTCSGDIMLAKKFSKLVSNKKIFKKPHNMRNDYPSVCWSVTEGG